MERVPTAVQIEKEANEVGLSIVKLCALSSSTTMSFHRYKRGAASPSVDMVNRWIGAINAKQEEMNDKETK